jgi:hypothetical protein
VTTNGTVPSGNATTNGTKQNNTVP